MEYKIGDKIKNRGEYIDSCLDFITLQNKIKPGNKIWMIQIFHLVESEFLNFKKCKWQDEFSSTISCQTCKGYFWIKNRFGHSNQICVGQSRKLNSNIYRIRYGNLLEDSLFEI